MFYILGLEEFEEKVDKIAEGQDTGDSWISQIFNQFSFLDDVDNQLTETDLDGIEPPILDETWGLGIRNSSALKSRTDLRSFFAVSGLMVHIFCLMSHLNSNDIWKFWQIFYIIN